MLSSTGLDFLGSLLCSYGVSLSLAAALYLVSRRCGSEWLSGVWSVPLRAPVVMMIFCANAYLHSALPYAEISLGFIRSLADGSG